MMRSLKYSITICLVLVFMVMTLFSSCAYLGEYVDEGEQSVPVLLDIRSDLMAGVRSVVKEQFEPGDQMGLFMVKHQTAEVYVEGANVCTTYQENGTWKHNFYLDNQKLNVYAYYPYETKSGVYIGSGKNPYLIYSLQGNMDFLIGRHTENTPAYVDRSNPVVYLHMQHALATVEFFIRKDNYTGEGKVTGIELTNRKAISENVIPLEVSIDLVAGTITPAGDGEYSQRLVNKNGLMPDISTSYPDIALNFFTLTRGSLKATGDAYVTFTIDGKEYKWNVPGKTEWKSGYRYSYYVTISGSKLILDTVSIVEPANGGSLEVIL